MTAQILTMPQRLACSACGATVDAACTCGAAYVPASQRAAAAITAHPEKSNRILAAETGVGLETVRRARQATDPHGSVEKRIGKDGKARRLPAQDDEAEDSDLPGIQRKRFLSNARFALSVAVNYPGPATKALAKTARQVAVAWLKLAQDMEDRTHDQDQDPASHVPVQDRTRRGRPATAPDRRQGQARQ